MREETIGLPGGRRLQLVEESRCFGCRVLKFAGDGYTVARLWIDEPDLGVVVATVAPLEAIDAEANAIAAAVFPLGAALEMRFYPREVHDITHVVEICHAEVHDITHVVEICHAEPLSARGWG